MGAGARAVAAETAARQWGDCATRGSEGAMETWQQETGDRAHPGSHGSEADEDCLVPCTWLG